MALVDVFTYHSALSLEVAPMRPWRLGPWVWATQGQILVALADDGSEADSTPDKMLKAQHYLSDAPTHAVSVSLPALRAFAGPAQSGSKKCSRCDGEGYEPFGETMECEHCGQWTRRQCERCDGAGNDDSLEVRYATVAGVPVNLALLAFGLAQVPTDETCTIGQMKSVKKDSGLALAVVGATWRVVVMSVRDVPPEAPTFGEPSRVGAAEA